MMDSESTTAMETEAPRPLSGAWLEDNPRAATLLTFVVGLLLGWWVLGWWLFPVSWSEAQPYHLRQDLRADWVQLVANDYQGNGQLDKAAERLASMDAATLITEFEALQADEIAQAPGLAPRVGPGHAAGCDTGGRRAEYIERQGDVVQHGAPGHQVGGLEDEADLRSWAGHWGAVHQDFALVRSQQAAHQAQQRAFAAARRPHQRNELAVMHVEADVGQRLHHATVLQIALAQPRGCNQRVAHKIRTLHATFIVTHM